MWTKSTIYNRDIKSGKSLHGYTITHWWDYRLTMYFSCWIIRIITENFFGVKLTPFK